MYNCIKNQLANTYTQIHLQLIFGVKYREALIDPNWETELHKYISEIIMKRSHKLLCFNGVEDHLHVLIGYRPSAPKGAQSSCIVPKLPKVRP